MGQTFPALTDKHIAFIEAQKLFFVGTATADSKVNISPKGMPSLKILSPERVLWLNVTGSGNETAAHVLSHPRMTLMFCAFDGAPLILRIYGTATATHPRDAAWAELYAPFEPIPGARQIFDVRVAMVQTSCGMAVPNFSYEGDRDLLRNWADKKGPDGLDQYWAEKNQFSLDGIASQILAQEPGNEN